MLLNNNNNIRRDIMSKVIKANDVSSMIGKIKHWKRKFPKLTKIYCLGISKDQKVFVKWAFIGLEII